MLRDSDRKGNQSSRSWKTIWMVWREKMKLLKLKLVSWLHCWRINQRHILNKRYRCRVFSSLSWKCSASHSLLNSSNSMAMLSIITLVLHNKIKLHLQTTNLGRFTSWSNNYNQYIAHLRLAILLLHQVRIQVTAIRPQLLLILILLHHKAITQLIK